MAEMAENRKERDKLSADATALRDRIEQLLKDAAKAEGAIKDLQVAARCCSGMSASPVAWPSKTFGSGLVCSHAVVRASNDILVIMNNMQL